MNPSGRTIRESDGYHCRRVEHFFKYTQREIFGRCCWWGSCLL